MLAAEYQPVGETALRVYFFTPKGAKRGSYYLADGQNAEKIFLASPVKFSRISSGFDRKRKHPILGYTKAHLGVDYAAPKGTPVWAVASGKVTFAGWKGANGRLIRIDHGNGLVTAYAHLHRIRKGIKRGKKVKQKQIIGYVSSTGQVRGPIALCMRKKGRYVDQLRSRLRMGPLPKRDRKRFDALVETMNTRLNEAAPSNLIQAIELPLEDDTEGTPLRSPLEQAIFKYRMVFLTGLMLWIAILLGGGYISAVLRHGWGSIYLEQTNGSQAKPPFFASLGRT